MGSSFLETALLPDAIERPGSEFVARLAKDSHASRSAWVLELAMTPASGDDHPAIVREQPEDFAHLHAWNYAPRRAGRPPRGLTCKVTGDHGVGEATPVGVRVDRRVRRQMMHG